MKLPRRDFLHLAAGAAALPAVGEKDISVPFKSARPALISWFSLSMIIASARRSRQFHYNRPKQIFDLRLSPNLATCSACLCQILFCEKIPPALIVGAAAEAANQVTYTKGNGGGRVRALLDGCAQKVVGLAGGFADGVRRS